MPFLGCIELLVIIFLVSELLIPAIRGTKSFPILRNLRFNKQIVEVNTNLEQEDIREHLVEKELSLQNKQITVDLKTETLRNKISQDMEKRRRKTKTRKHYKIDD